MCDPDAQREITGYCERNQILHVRWRLSKKYFRKLSVDLSGFFIQTSTMVASLPKKKSASSSVEESNTSFLAQITQFEAKLLGPTYNPNPLLPLISLSRHGSPPVVHKAVWSLHRVFIKYISEGKVGGFGGNGKREEEADLSVLRDKEGRESKEVKGWVRDRLLEYLEILGGMIRDSEESLRVS